jgi:hypothetical protein
MNANPTMTPDKLATMGRALYGERWQTALAMNFGIADRTMRRWLTGESPIPSGIAEELQKLLTERMRKMDVLSELPSDLVHRDGNFTEAEFNKLLKAIFSRGDKKWVTPSGSIIDVLRGFIKAGEIDNVSVACRFYFKIHGKGAADYVSRQLPGLIINNYEPLIGKLTFNEFLRWSNDNLNWQDEIVNNAASPNLSAKVHRLVANLSAFKKRA